MPLKKQTMTLSLSTSANQKGDPKSLSPGTPTLVQNARFQKGGRVDKRFGYNALSMINATPLTYYETYFFSQAALASADRIVFSGDTVNTIRMDFDFPTGQDAPFAAEVFSDLNTPGGTLSITDKNGVFWLISDNGTGITTGSFSFADWSRFTIRLRDSTVDSVTVLKDGAASTTEDMQADFAEYVAADYATFTAFNPRSLGKYQGEAIGELKNIAGSEDHLLLRAGWDVYSYSETEDRFLHVGNHLPCQSTINSVDETGKPLLQVDVTYVEGITYYSLTEMLINASPTFSVILHVMAIDEATGEVVLHPEQIFAGQDSVAKLIEFNGQAYVFYTKLVGIVDQIFGRPITLAGAGSEVQLAVDVATTGNWCRNSFDVINWKDDRIVLLFSTDSNGGFELKYFDADLVTLVAPYDPKSITNLFSYMTNFALVPSSSGDRFFCLGTANTINGIEYAIVNESGAVDTIETATAFVVGGDLSNGTAAGFAGNPGQSSGKDGVQCMISTNMTNYTTGKGTYNFHIADDGTETTGANLYDISPISKGWEYDGQWFYLFVRRAPLDTSYFIGTNIDGYLNYSCQVLYGRVTDEDSDYTTGYSLSNIVEISPGIARVGLISKDIKTQVPGAVSLKIDYTSKELFTSIPYGRSMLIGGTNVHSFGGQYLRELNFFHAPRAPLLTDTASGGEVTDGLHSVVVVYEFTDTNGYLHRSNPSQPTTITVAEGDVGTIVVEITNYVNSNMDPEVYDLVKLIPYRTEVNGEVYYRDDYVETTPYIHNNQLGETRTITLTRSDVDLSNQAILYTFSGEKPPTPVPPITSMASWGSRIWLGGSARDEAVYFSKLNQTNLMPEFSELFSISIQDTPGRSTAVTGFSDKMVLAKRGRLYYTYGAGPDLTGVGIFAPFEEIQGVSGVVNGKSLTVNKWGVNFKSDKGIFTLTSSLETVHSGASYEDEADEPIIKSINPIESDELRYVTASGIIAYNNFFNNWSKDSSSNLVPIDACLYNHGFYVLTSEAIFEEVQETWIDVNLAEGPASYAMSVETGWTSFAGLAGFQRFYKMFIVMDNLTPYTVTVSLAYDYGDYVDFTTFEDTTDSRIIIYPSKQKCEAFRVKIEVDANGETEQSLNINFIGIVAGMKVGLPKQLPVAQRIGVSTI